MILGLKNSYVQNLLRELCPKTFKGVFPIDLIPNLYSKKYRDKTISLVVNLDPHYKSGSHFVAFYKTKTNIVYFDSFGKDPNSELDEYLQKFNLPVEISKLKIQSNLSNFCGYFCIGFILSQEIRIDLKFFLQFFHYCESENHLLGNDNLISHFINTYIKTFVKNDRKFSKK